MLIFGDVKLQLPVSELPEIQSNIASFAVPPDSSVFDIIHWVLFVSLLTIQPAGKSLLLKFSEKTLLVGIFALEVATSWL